MGLRLRLYLVFLTIGLLVAGVQLTLSYLSFARILAQRQDQELRRFAQTFRYSLILDPTPHIDPQRYTALAPWSGGRVQIRRGGEIELVYGGPFPKGPGWAMARFALPGGLDLRVALPSLGLEVLKEELRSSLTILPLTLFLSLGAGLFLLRYLTRPLQELTQAAQLISEERFPDPLKIPPGNDELAHLARSFNRMSEKIQMLLERERTFTRYASHELRTPLAGIRAQVESLELGLSSPEEALPLLKASIDRMQKLIEGLLYLARTPQVRLAPVPLRSLAEQVVEEFRPQVELLPGQEAVALGQLELLLQAVHNLIENALRHGKEPVWVSVERQGSRAILSVRDQGPGVPEEALPHLVEPFYRLKRNTPGFGLGLAFVYHIARALGGQLELANRSPGLEVRLILKAL